MKQIFPNIYQVQVYIHTYKYILQIWYLFIKHCLYYNFVWIYISQNLKTSPPSHRNGCSYTYVCMYVHMYVYITIAQNSVTWKRRHQNLLINSCYVNVFGQLSKLFHILFPTKYKFLIRLFHYLSVFFSLKITKFTIINKTKFYWFQYES